MIWFGAAAEGKEEMVQVLIGAVLMSVLLFTHWTVMVIGEYKKSK